MASLDRIPFGNTGHESSRVIFGAAALGGARQEMADRVLADVRASGINHIDTAAGYGASEVRLAPFLRSHRNEFFLATKTGARSGDGARAELERSLERLGVDSVDLIQLHNLVEEDDWATAHGPNGAVAAMVKAKEEGLVRHIGVTGHGIRIPRMHLRSLEQFPFASVLFPYNAALLRNPAYREDVEELISVCHARNVAMQTIKSVAKRRWPEDAEPRRFSWYEPLLDEDAIARAVRFVLAQPGLFVNSSSDTRILPAIVAAATRTDRNVAPSEQELDEDARQYGILPLFDGAELERI